MKKNRRSENVTLLDFYAAHAIRPVNVIMEEAPGIAESAFEVAYQMCKKRAKWIKKLDKKTLRHLM